MKKKILLKTGFILLLLLYGFLYIRDPLDKNFDIGLIALIFSIFFLIIQVVSRKKEIREIIYLFLAIGFICAYFLT